jgi:thiamine-monophosphate kinase
VSEFGFINDLRPLADRDHALDFQDDAATMPPADVICTDTLVESVHFFGSEPAGELAHKMLAVNVSDVLAMNARPTHALLNLSLPQRCDAAWRADFVAGLKAACAHFDLRLLGGDTTGAPTSLVLMATVIGALDGRALWRRSGARVGDRICVGGAIGAGALGLRDMQNGETGSTFAQHFRQPMPRMDLLDATGVGGCADVSDGLIADLIHICQASNVTGVLDLTHVPYADPSADWAAQVAGGDDYQLVFTLSPEFPLPTGCTVVGEITQRQLERSVILDGPAAVIRAAQANLGYTHF